MDRREKLLLLLGGLLLIGAVAIAPFFARGQSKTSTVTPADYLRWKTEFKNWGRWGADDERGTTNLITAAKIVAVAKLVKTGQVVSLAHAVPQKTDGFSRPGALPNCKYSSGLPQFVTMRGGAYFFLPGLAALKWIASD